MIDEVQIYNRALLPTEVQNLYNADSAGICQPGSHNPPATTANVNPPADAQGIYPGPVTVSLAAMAATGFTINATYYTIDGGVPQTYTDLFIVSGDGIHTVEYWSVDNSGLVEQHKTLTIQIAGLRITTESPLPTGIVGQPYSTNLTAAGGVPPYIWGIAAGALPPGLTLDSATGVISGIPTTAGTFGFTIRVTDSASNTATKPFGFAPPPSSGNAGSGYTLPIHIDPVPDSGGSDPGICTTYAVVGDPLPDGLTLDQNTGVINGTPTNGGTYNFTIGCLVSGGQNSGQTVTKDFTITIYNPVPTITGLDPAFVTVGGPDFWITVNGANFVPASSVQWNGTSRTTNYLSATQLQAQIPATDIAAVGTANITVVNPEPGGGVSASVPYPIYPVTPPVVNVTFSPNGQQGWFTTSSALGSVTVSALLNITAITCEGVTVNNLTGLNTLQARGDLSVDGDGVHTVICTATDSAGNSGAGPGSTNTATVRIDTTPPTLAPAVTPNPVLLGGAATVTSGAADSLSGLATESCGAVDASSVGSKIVTCTATDKAGNTASANASYTVIYNFSGFFPPVDNLSVLNGVKAGSAVPVKFSLGGNQELTILAAGYPASQKIACDTSAPVDDIEQTVTAGSSSLTYDAASDQYSYVWKTDKAWTGSCRQLIVRLSDGTDHKANFNFK